MVASHDQSMHQHSEWFFRQPPGERASRASDGCAHIAPMPAPDGPVRASAFVSLQGQGEHWSAPRFAGIRGRVGLRRWRPSRVRLRVPRRRASERAQSGSLSRAGRPGSPSAVMQACAYGHVSRKPRRGPGLPVGYRKNDSMPVGCPNPTPAVPLSQPGWRRGQSVPSSPAAGPS